MRYIVFIGICFLVNASVMIYFHRVGKLYKVIFFVLRIMCFSVSVDCRLHCEMEFDCNCIVS